MLLSVNCNKNDKIVETILLTTSNDTEKLKFIRGLFFFTGVNFLHVECDHIYWDGTYSSGERAYFSTSNMLKNDPGHYSRGNIIMLFTDDIMFLIKLWVLRHCQTSGPNLKYASFLDLEYGTKLFAINPSIYKLSMSTMQSLNVLFWMNPEII